MPDIGPTLREARMRLKIDIAEVETRTKIRARYLRAIENEEWDLLPGPVYAKSFLRTYGDFLGLDSGLLIDDFKRRHDSPPDQELNPIASGGRERERFARGPLLPPWAIIGVVLVLIVGALYLLGGTGGPSTTSTPRAGAHPGAHPGAPASTHRPPAPTLPATLPARPRTVTLRLQATGQVYVCLVNGRGKRLIPGLIFAAGQRIASATAGRLLLTLGNASVRMTVNGAAVSVPSSQSSIGFGISPSGNKRLPVSQQPRCA
ncbi:MAG: helix-turn-helix domain-containing protein [Solirubrobacteraceae bacterium]